MVDTLWDHLAPIHSVNSVPVYRILKVLQIKLETNCESDWLD